jgi:hypothetical protein
VRHQHVRCFAQLTASHRCNWPPTASFLPAHVWASYKQTYRPHHGNLCCSSELRRNPRSPARTIMTLIDAVRFMLPSVVAERKVRRVLKNSLSSFQYNTHQLLHLSLRMKRLGYTETSEYFQFTTDEYVCINLSSSLYPACSSQFVSVPTGVNVSSHLVLAGYFLCHEVTHRFKTNPANACRRKCMCVEICHKDRRLVRFAGPKGPSEYRA